MINCSRIIVRPSTDIKWHFDPDVIPNVATYRQHFRETYIETGKCIFDAIDFSEDELTLTYNSAWVTIDEYNICDQDPIMQEFWALRDAYYAPLGVILSPVVVG